MRKCRLAMVGMAVCVLHLVWIHPIVGHTNKALTGKRAFVTGSSGGIGRGIALELAACGATVLLHYNTRREGAQSTQTAILQNGGRCAGIVQCDFRNPMAIRDMFATIEKTIWPIIDNNDADDDNDDVGDVGGMDILVNNAGVVSKVPLEDEDDDLSQWHETLQINLHAPLQLSRLVVEHMKERQHVQRLRKNNNNNNNVVGGGVIINVSSIHGERSNEYMSAYAASKAALNSLTRSMAMEYASLGIRVNGIAPGVVPVERTAHYFSKVENVEHWTKHIPLERVGTIEHIAQAAIPLITNEWVTGTIWTVDGGMMARSNMPFRERPPKPMVRNG